MLFAGIAIIRAFYFLIGYVTQRYSFEPIVIAASIIPCIATAVFVGLVRANKTPDPNRILMDF